LQDARVEKRAQKIADQRRNTEPNLAGQLADVTVRNFKLDKRETDDNAKYIIPYFDKIVLEASANLQGRIPSPSELQGLLDWGWDRATAAMFRDAQARARTRRTTQPAARAANLGAGAAGGGVSASERAKIPQSISDEDIARAKALGISVQDLIEADAGRDVVHADSDWRNDRRKVGALLER
jgi:hypothetical protein